MSDVTRNMRKRLPPIKRKHRSSTGPEVATSTIRRGGSAPAPPNGFSISEDGEAFLLKVLEDDDFEQGPRKRASTFTNGVNPRRGKSIPKNSKKSEEVISMSAVSSPIAFPRHYQRRKAIVGNELVHGQKPLEDTDTDDIHVVVEGEDQRMSEEISPQINLTLSDALVKILIKTGLSMELQDCTITAERNGIPMDVDLHRPSYDYAASTVEMKEIQYHRAYSPDSSTGKSEHNHKEALELTVEDCLSYFDRHGLVELPSSSHSNPSSSPSHQPLGDEDTCRLPEVTPVEPIPDSWDELPIDSALRNSLSLREQQTLWELISTEHSHLRQLEIIINLFMQCLELIRRTGLLNENYHNVFGYIEDIYKAHEQFWTWTLRPCLDKVYKTGLPLDVYEIIHRFPQFSTHFEVYDQHFALDSVNLCKLNEAMENADFKAYLHWCESHPECRRRTLKSFLAAPMQRLTKYKILISAIIKETSEGENRQLLQHISSEVDGFVQSVNTVLQTQYETERVRDAMNRIVSYCAVDVPGELKELVHPHTHLDLLAPMPDVDMDRTRVLMLEGTLKYRDVNTARLVVHVFLFTDMLLITKTKPPKKGGKERYAVFKPPYKISLLAVHSTEPGSFSVIVLNEYHVVSTLFTLKAHSDSVAKEWMHQIATAQQFYAEAIVQKAVNWRHLQALRSERTLNGITQSDHMTSEAPLHPGQSLLSLSSRHSLSNESILSNDQGSPPNAPSWLEKCHLTLQQTQSPDARRKALSRSQPALVHALDRTLSLDASLPSWLGRAASLSTLVEKSRYGPTGPRYSTQASPFQKVLSVETFPLRHRSSSMISGLHSEVSTMQSLSSSVNGAIHCSEVDVYGARPRSSSMVSGIRCSEVSVDALRQLHLSAVSDDSSDEEIHTTAPSLHPRPRRMKSEGRLGRGDHAQLKRLSVASSAPEPLTESFSEMDYSNISISPPTPTTPIQLHTPTTPHVLSVGDGMTVLRSPSPPSVTHSLHDPGYCPSLPEHSGASAHKMEVVLNGTTGRDISQVHRAESLNLPLEGDSHATSSLFLPHSTSRSPTDNSSPSLSSSADGQRFRSAKLHSARSSSGLDVVESSEWVGIKSKRKTLLKQDCLGRERRISTPARVGVSQRGSSPSRHHHVMFSDQLRTVPSEKGADTEVTAQPNGAPCDTDARSSPPHKLNRRMSVPAFDNSLREKMAHSRKHGTRINVTPVSHRSTKMGVQELLQMFESKSSENSNAHAKPEQSQSNPCSPTTPKRGKTTRQQKPLSAPSHDNKQVQPPTHSSFPHDQPSRQLESSKVVTSSRPGILKNRGQHADSPTIAQQPPHHHVLSHSPPLSSSSSSSSLYEAATPRVNHNSNFSNSNHLCHAHKKVDFVAPLSSPSPSSCKVLRVTSSPIPLHRALFASSHTPFRKSPIISMPTSSFPQQQRLPGMVREPQASRGHLTRITVIVQPDKAM